MNYGIKFFPLTTEIGLLYGDRSSRQDEIIFTVKLDWKNNSAHVVDSGFKIPWSEIVNFIYIFPDRAIRLNNVNEMFFLMYVTRERCYKYCQISQKDFKMTQIGRDLNINEEDYECLDLNGNLITGINKSATEIKRYDLKNRQLINTIQLKGLPKNILCEYDLGYLVSLYLQ